MKTLQDIIVEAQTLLADLQALASTSVPTVDPVVSIETTTESGAKEDFTPEALPAEPVAPAETPAE